MADPLITFVLPYYNEAGFIRDTLASIAGQTDRRFVLVLVDNGSTDASSEIAQRAIGAMPDIPVALIHEATPGKLFALRTGVAEAETGLVGTMDADTYYPPEYVARTLALFGANPGCSSVLAFGTDKLQASASKWLQSRVWPGHCHTGGFGQNFRTDALREIGQFDSEIWPFVLEDHEIMARLHRHGPVVYDRAHICHPSDRRDDRTAVSWTPAERVLYKLRSPASHVRFFHDFLAPRFAARGLSTLRLREQQWQAGEDA